MDTQFLKKLARFCFLGIALCGGQFHAAADPIALLSPTNFWKYNDESVDLGTAWIATNYNDSAWSNGISAFGFRSLNNTNYQLPPPNYIATLVRKTTPTNAARNIMTFYFRTHFTFTNDPGGMTLVASNLIDDGAIFYMNGQELTRVAMPSGPVAWDTAATRGDLIGTNRTPTIGTHGYDVFSVPINALVQGDNVVAVEVHQASTSSSAMAFQMELWADFPAPTFLAITNEPQDVVVEEGKAASFDVGISGTGGRFQWYRQGVGPIPNAIVETYSLAPAVTNDTGFYFVVVTNLVNSVTSRVVRVTVFVDANPPTLIDADGSSSTTNVLVTFSEAILPATATNIANYKITNTMSGTVGITRAVLTSPTNVMLTTSNARVANTNYILIVNGIRDTSPRTNLIVTNSMIPISNLGTLIRLGSSGWKFVDPVPPDDNPDLGTAWRASVYDDSWWAAGSGVFFYGFDESVVPGPVGSHLSQSGSFISYFRYALSGLAGGPGSQRLLITYIVDDGAVFYLNGTEFFRTNMPAGPVNFQTRASAAVSPIRVGPVPFTNSFLPSGNVLAVELHQFNAPDVDKVFGLQLDAYVDSVRTGPAIITGGPFDVTVIEGQSASFRAVQVGGASFQWQQNNANIPGANSDVYTIQAVPLSLNNMQYRVTVTGSSGDSVTSTNARLRVLADTNAPVLVAAYANTDSISVSFSENVSAASANNAANYTVTNVAGQIFAVTSAVLTNGTNAILSFATLPPGTYFVVVNNVRDTSVAGNMIAANSTVKAGFNATVVSIDGSWRYNQRTNDLTTQGWAARTYNDSGWTGTGLGLLDGKAGGRAGATLPFPVRTVLLAPTNGPGGAYLNTVYFRTHFDSFASGTGTVTFRTVMDDAGIIYLNGVEINRIRMGAGPVIYSTFGGGAPAGDATVEGPFTVTVTNLLTGDNVIAVEVHQSALGSTDVTWGGDFSVFVPSTPLATNVISSCTNIPIAAPILLHQRVNGTNVILSWVNTPTNSCGSNAVFTLQQALSFTNPVSATVWSDVTTVSPYTAVGTNKSRFFRLKR